MIVSLHTTHRDCLAAIKSKRVGQRFAMLQRWRKDVYVMWLMCDLKERVVQVRIRTVNFRYFVLKFIGWKFVSFGG